MNAGTGEGVPADPGEACCCYPEHLEWCLEARGGDLKGRETRGRLKENNFNCRVFPVG